MKNADQCTHEGRTPRLNMPVCHHSKWRRLLEPFIAPPTRLHRYRNLSVRALENTLDDLDCKKCV